MDLPRELLEMVVLRVPSVLARSVCKEWREIWAKWPARTRVADIRWSSSLLRWARLSRSWSVGIAVSIGDVGFLKPRSWADCLQIESAIAVHDAVEVLSWCPHKESLRLRPGFYAAAPACVRWLVERGYRFCQDDAIEVARGGVPEVIRIAHRHGCKMTERCMAVLARSGSLEAVRTAVERGGVCTYDSVLAAELNSVDVLRFVYVNAQVVPFALGRVAARSGDIAKLEFLKSVGTVFDSRCNIVAIEARQMDVLQWLVDAGCKVDADVRRSAEGYAEAMRIAA
jgi:hypothetical protein